MECKEECGILGIWAPQKAVFDLCFSGLFALQHRGQEGAGIALCCNNTMRVIKGKGLVYKAINHKNIHLEGKCAIGHVLYSLSEEKSEAEIQPLSIEDLPNTAISFNGRLTNYVHLRNFFEEKGTVFYTNSDAEVILYLLSYYIATSPNDLENALIKLVTSLEGGFSVILMIGETLVAFRDSSARKPLSLGKLNEDGIIISSESCAITSVKATLLRDIKPGEIVIINGRGMKSFLACSPSKKQICAFEYVYFARGDSIIDNISVWESRYRMGQQLALEKKFDADIVVGVPSSGIAAAIGYSAQSGIPYLEGILKNAYIGRSFILPKQKQRVNAVQLKLAPVQKILEGKSIVLVDDSLVRGTTMRHVVSMLKDCGTKKIYLCVSSPPIINVCNYGIDMGTQEELIATQVTRENLANVLECDEVYYLSYRGLINAVGHSDFCCQCLNK